MKRKLFLARMFVFIGKSFNYKETLAHTHADAIRCWEAEYQSNCNSVVHSRVDDDENKRPRQRGAPCSSATCFFFFFFSSLSSQVHHGRRGENFELKTSERRRTSRVFIWTLLYIIRKHFFLFLAFILLREMLGEDAGLFRYYTQHAYVYYTVERIYSVHLYELVCMYRRWRSRHRHDFKCLNGEITFEGSYHFAVVRIESLVDQRELFTAETTLQIQQMAKHPRLILSSHNHYQLMASAIIFLTFCIVCVCFWDYTDERLSALSPLPKVLSTHQISSYDV